MKFFSAILTLDELKAEYRRLAMANHPDKGGDAEIMKAINTEYDFVFPVIKARENSTSSETAQSTRSEFYTANGWKGDNYNADITLKEIAQLVREFVKQNFPHYRFSIRTKYASMCQSIIIEMKEAPAEIYKTLDELNSDDVCEIIRRANRNGDWTLSTWNDEEARAEIVRLLQRGDFYKVLTDDARTARDAVDAFVNSYNYSDCDGMIDYFDVNFWFHGCSVRGVKIVPRKAPSKPQTESTAEPATVARVEINPEHNGIEAYFTGKPSEAVRSALKADGWRWHSKKQCWYNKNTESHLHNLRNITEQNKIGAMA